LSKCLYHVITFEPTIIHNVIFRAGCHIVNCYKYRVLYDTFPKIY